MIWVASTASPDAAFEFHAIRWVVPIKFIVSNGNVSENGQIVYLVLVALDAEAFHIVHCNYMVDFAADASRVTVKTNSVSTMGVVYPGVSMSGSLLTAYWGLECREITVEMHVINAVVFQ